MLNRVDFMVVNVCDDIVLSYGRLVDEGRTDMSDDECGVVSELSLNAILWEGGLLSTLTGGSDDVHR